MKNNWPARIHTNSAHAAWAGGAGTERRRWRRVGGLDW